MACKDEMTSRERILTAIQRGKPDRVPITPDISNMIPCKLTGKPFWDIYLYKKIGKFDAYSLAVDYFNFDGWFFGGAPDYIRENEPIIRSNIVEKKSDSIIERKAFITNCGELTEETVYRIADPPAKRKRLIDDIKNDFGKLKCFYGKILNSDATEVERRRKITGDRGIFCLLLPYPGMHYFSDFFRRNLEDAIYAYMDYPELFEEWEYIMRQDLIRQTEIILDLKPDVFFLTGSGTVTLSNPELVRKFSLPAIKTLTKMAKEAGIPSMLHSCGKSADLLEMLTETDLDCINPLEEPPLGDVYLKHVKEKYGDQFCLMGGLNTTELMLNGSIKAVEAATCKAIDDAASGGGFILSTGDQCGRDTPYENLYKMIEVAKVYGRY